MLLSTNYRTFVCRKKIKWSQLSTKIQLVYKKETEQKNMKHSKYAVFAKKEGAAFQTHALPTSPKMFTNLKVDMIVTYMSRNDCNYCSRITLGILNYLHYNMHCAIYLLFCFLS